MKITKNSPLWPVLTIVILTTCLLISANFDEHKTNPRDYHIEIKGNKALVYDCNTFKGIFILSGQLDSLITKDNQ